MLVWCMRLMSNSTTSSTVMKKCHLLNGFTWRTFENSWGPGHMAPINISRITLVPCICRNMISIRKILTCITLMTMFLQKIKFKDSLLSIGLPQKSDFQKISLSKSNDFAFKYALNISLSLNISNHLIDFEVVSIDFSWNSLLPPMNRLNLLNLLIDWLNWINRRTHYFYGVKRDFFLN